MIDAETGRYREYSASSDYESLGVAKEGSDFFADASRNVLTRIVPDDLSVFLKEFTKENILDAIVREGLFKMNYRLLIDEKPVPVHLRAAVVPEGDRELLIIGVSRGNS